MYLPVILFAVVAAATAASALGVVLSRNIVRSAVWLLFTLVGVSLTVNEVARASFGVNIVPHTLTHTTLGAKRPGDRVNLEADVFARYVVRAMEFRT